MDSRPETARVKDLLTSWNPSWNPVALELEQISATANAYGRFAQIHTLANQITSIEWLHEHYMALMQNMSDTLNNLAACRLYEEANKIFVNTLAAYDPTNPNAICLTLGNDPSQCQAPLSWDAIAFAIY